MDWRVARRAAFLALLVACIVGALGFWFIGSALTAPTNRVVAPIAAPAKTLTIDSGDSVQLAATYWASGDAAKPAILLLHGNGGSRADMVPTAEWLVSQGYAVLAPDFRGHGESTPNPKSFGWFEANDAHAAFAWLRQHHPGSKIGVIGFSLGGAAALVGEKGPLPADAMVLEAVFPDIRAAIYNRLAAHMGAGAATVIEPLLSIQSWLRYGVGPDAISPRNALEKVKVPVMIVGGGADRYTPPNETRSMFEAAHRNGEIWILEGLAHNQVVSDQSPAMRQRLSAFLARTLERK